MDTHRLFAGDLLVSGVARVLHLSALSEVEVLDQASGLFVQRQGFATAALSEVLGRRVVDVYRRLAEANPAAYLPDLAMSLNNLADTLDALNRPQEAAEVRQELTKWREV